MLARWRAEGIAAKPVDKPWVPPGTVFELTTRMPEAEADQPERRSHAVAHLAGLPSFLEGRFYIQDPSTLLAVRMLEAQPGERILDLCAAPGGKTAYLAQEMNNQGILFAADLDEPRLALVRQNVERLGVTCATITRTADLPVPEPANLFDKVLVDAPCSNTGVLRRRIELRWRLSPEEIRRLATQQKEILARAAARTRPGGLLAYSTCSLEPEENAEIVAAFLKTNAGWTLQEQKDLLPFRDGADGAFVAVLKKAS